MLSKLSSFLISFSLVYGFYTHKPEAEHKLKCDRCGNTYFTISEKISKFVGEGNYRIKKTGRFYKCTKCSVTTDEIVTK